MKNPATIPDNIMREIERRISHAASLQETRRHVVRHHGRREWEYLTTTPHERHGRERSQAARWLREIRGLIAANGYEVWHVCAIARDPDAFAFCDGGGATAADLA
jgi:hypothetical protein